MVTVLEYQRSPSNEENNAGVVYKLGNRQGKGRDEFRAVQCFQKAARQGCVEAVFNLGLSYEGGSGIPKDIAEAVRLYRKASDLGNAFASFALGLCYERGLGVPWNPSEAARLSQEALERGCPYAVNGLWGAPKAAPRIDISIVIARRWK
jgi:TPR repeat protein